MSLSLILAVFAAPLSAPAPLALPALPALPAFSRRAGGLTGGKEQKQSDEPGPPRRARLQCRTLIGHSSFFTSAEQLAEPPSFDMRSTRSISRAIQRARASRKLANSRISGIWRDGSAPGRLDVWTSGLSAPRLYRATVLVTLGRIA
jgi:hypothetical protein